jgi:hypothetical protein
VAKKAQAATFAAVREIGRGLSGVEESTAYGSPALRVNGRMFACLAVHRSAEPGSLVVTVGFDQRDALLAEDPSTYYLTPHYVNHPSVLVRLDRVRLDALKDLLISAHRLASATSRTTARKRSRRQNRA